MVDQLMLATQNQVGDRVTQLQFGSAETLHALLEILRRDEMNPEEGGTHATFVSPDGIARWRVERAARARKIIEFKQRPRRTSRLWIGVQCVSGLYQRFMSLMAQPEFRNGSDLSAKWPMVYDAC